MHACKSVVLLILMATCMMHACLAAGRGSYESQDACMQAGGISAAGGGIDPASYPAPQIPPDTGCNYAPRSVARTNPNDACPHMLPDVRCALALWHACSCSPMQRGAACGLRRAALWRAVINFPPPPFCACAGCGRMPPRGAVRASRSQAAPSRCRATRACWSLAAHGRAPAPTCSPVSASLTAARWARILCFASNER